MKFTYLQNADKEKVVTSVEELEEFLSTRGATNDDLKSLTKLFHKGHDVYWCRNPYSMEIHDCVRLMWNKDKETLSENYCNARDEI